MIKKCDLKYTIIKRKIYTLLQYYRDEPFKASGSNIKFHEVQGLT